MNGTSGLLMCVAVSVGSMGAAVVAGRCRREALGWTILGVLLGGLVVALLFGGPKADALDRPETTCHRTGAQTFDCTLHVNDPDGDYRVRTWIVEIGQRVGVIVWRSRAEESPYAVPTRGRP